MKKLYFEYEKELFKQELDGFYSKYPVDIFHIKLEFDKFEETHSDMSSYELKAYLYELAAEHCDVHIFRHSPFYYELVSGRTRNSWGVDGVGAWVREKRFSKSLEEFQEWVNVWGGNTGLFILHLLDLDHHCPGYDKIFKLGLNGIIEEAKERLSRINSKEQKDFLCCVIRANEAVKKIANRFAERASDMIKQEHDPEIKSRLNLIWKTAKLIPANPPETFYEALCTILFIREITGSLEGLGISVFGHLDRLLFPYYERDLSNGLINYEQAKNLLKSFLAITDFKFDLRNHSYWQETSTVIVIGGCDEKGDIIANDITYMIIDSYQESNLVNPKLNARISGKHPEEYFKKLSELASKGRNTLAIFNDEVLIDSHVRQGKDIKDARLYVSGGCQEPIVGGFELSKRASFYINLPLLLYLISDKEKGEKWWKECNLDFSLDGSFESFYLTFLKCFEATIEKVIFVENETGKLWKEVNPSPFLSSTIYDCVNNAKDITEGGSRYNPCSVSMVGFGTLVDSLYSIKKVVFEENQISILELVTLLRNNFKGNEKFRKYLINRVAKYGHGYDDIDRFAGRLADDLARITMEQRTFRGGNYEASFFAYWTFFALGQQSPATPDGRRTGEPFSEGMGPGRLKQLIPTEVIGSVSHIDMKDYPGCGVLNIHLPLTLGDNNKTIILSGLIHGFIGNGGSVLQFQVMDKDTLIKAKKEPEKYKDLVVRVCGFSAYFTSLEERVQNEIIERIN